MTILGRLLGLVLGMLGLAAVLAIATLPLPPRAQAVLAVGSIAAFVLVDRLRGRAASLVLVALSAAVSLRYVFWRLTDTLDLPTWPEWGLGVGLIAAELYALATLLAGYAQAAWPLRRQPLPLPADPSAWPTVDVFIPTLNEPLAVVRATVLAALAMDWPPDHLVVWLLDDGGRAEFRDFAEACGCRYLARAEHRGAKAGNLNHALRHSRAAFVAVFDCDDVPTRAFLQLTLGWLVARPNLAFVQTPQHYRDPDPLQRNLWGGARVPAEACLFHGLLQDGNDTHNAAMFSGSCAVLRRAALEDVGGFSTATLTEDAHTSLRLHRRRWDSAFLRLPLAAGLAPESLAGHLRQRRRWTRGMLQILRRDNPLFGPGLSAGQRLCYAQATGHFLFALPRLAFLTAPLAFLLLGWSVIAASPLTLCAYAGPHLFHAAATSARLNGRWRAVFWGGVYETVLALKLVPVTLMTLLRPRRGRFEVTPKNGRPARRFFDARAVLPNLVLAALLLAGLGRAAAVAWQAGRDRLPGGALLLNAGWAAVSLLLVLVAVAAGREREGRARDRSALPVRVTLPDGQMLEGVTDGVFHAGARLRLDMGEVVGASVPVDVTLGDDSVTLPARVTASDAVVWTPATLAEEARVVRVVFGRADAWIAWQPRARVWLPVSLWRLLAAAAGLCRRRAATPVLVVAVALLAAPTARGQSLPDASDFSVRPIPGAPAETLPAPQPQTPPPSAATAPPSAAPAAGSRTVVYTLRQLGADGPLALRGTTPLLGVRFGIRADEVATAATLNLSGAVSPALIPDLSNVTVTLNGQYIATIPADRHTPAFTAEIPISPAMLQDADRLDFRLSGRSQADCDDPLSGLLWATIADSSTLTLTLQRLPPLRDLARLPLPFLDPADPDALVLPFVLPAAADNQTLRAAGIAAAWFAQRAGERGARFPVLSGPPSSGNAVLVQVGVPAKGLPGAPAIDGPTLAVLANPRDPLASVLLIAGRTGAEAAAAAAALAFGIRALSGASAAVQPPEMAARLPYDAPAWIATDHPVRLGTLVGVGALQASGYVGLLRVPFRTAPDSVDLARSSVRAASALAGAARPGGRPRGVAARYRSGRSLSRQPAARLGRGGRAAGVRGACRPAAA